MSKQSWFVRIFSALVLLALFALPHSAHSLSYVMVSDDKLFEDSELVVRATVIDPVDMSAGKRPDDMRRYNDYALRVQRVYKGQALTSVIFLRVLGAPIGEAGFHVVGAPRFQPGDDALLFLKRGKDGLWRLTQFHMGAFQVIQIGNQAVLSRDLDQAHDNAEGFNAQYFQPRNLEQFEEWLLGRSAGLRTNPDYFSKLSVVQAAELKFELINPPNHWRWREFNSQTPIEWHDSDNGQPDMNKDEREVILRALGAWINDPESGVYMVYRGSLPVSEAIDAKNDCGPENVVLWDNPEGLSTPGTFTCGQGGVLAVGGACFFSSDTETVNGVEFARAIGGRVITAENVGCAFNTQSDTFGDQVMAHEFGHVLGLGHSCGDSESPSCGSDPVLDEATMRATAHNKARGAEIKEDDQDGIRFIYPESGAPYQLAIYPTGSGTGTVTASATEIDCGAVCDDLVARETNVTLTATPASGSGFVGWSGDCPLTDESSIDVTMDQGRFCIAEFGDAPVVSYSVTTDVNGPGSIDPTGQTVEEGSTAEFTLTAGEGAQIDGASGCDGSLSGATYTTGAITADCTVTANFSLRSYSVDTSVSGPGSIDPGSDTVEHGSTTSFTLAPDTGAEIVSATGCGGSLSGSTYTTGAIVDACTVSAEFALVDYTVSTSVTGPGSISPTSASVTHGDTAEFTLAADAGAMIDSASGCGGSLSGNTYTTGTITGACTVSASFADDPDVIFRDRFEQL